MLFILAPFYAMWIKGRVNFFKVIYFELKKYPQKYKFSTFICQIMVGTRQEGLKMAHWVLGRSACFCNPVQGNYSSLTLVLVFRYKTRYLQQSHSSPSIQIEDKIFKVVSLQSQYSDRRQDIQSSLTLVLVIRQRTRYLQQSHSIPSILIEDKIFTVVSLQSQYSDRRQDIFSSLTLVQVF